MLQVIPLVLQPLDRGPVHLDAEALELRQARTVIRWADRHSHAQSRWIKDLIARRGKNKATAALANKLMRIVWSVLTFDVSFEMRKAFRPQIAR
jgi:hypothetical protein